jgi:hypothetical protein
MTTKKKIGIWMDHSTAHLIAFTNESNEVKEIDSAFTKEVKKDVMDKGQKTLHNTEQQDHEKYYRAIGAAIEDCESVILFGPTDAKTELLNQLKQDHHFDHINIQIEHTDKMTYNQEMAFVKAYFSKN